MKMNTAVVVMSIDGLYFVGVYGVLRKISSFSSQYNMSLGHFRARFCKRIPAIMVTIKNMRAAAEEIPSPKIL